MKNTCVRFITIEVLYLLNPFQGFRNEKNSLGFMHKSKNCEQIFEIFERVR